MMKQNNQIQQNIQDNQNNGQYSRVQKISWFITGLILIAAALFHLCYFPFSQHYIIELIFIIFIVIGFFFIISFFYEKSVKYIMWILKYILFSLPSILFSFYIEKMRFFFAENKYFDFFDLAYLIVVIIVTAIISYAVDTLFKNKYTK